MADPLTWLARPPATWYFSDDGKSVYFTQDRAGRDGRDLSRIELATGVSEQIDDARRGAADGEGGSLSRDRRFKTWAADGDVFWKNLQTGERRQLTRTAAQENAPIFLEGGRVAFQRGDAFFARDLATGLEAQVADLQLGKDPQEKAEPEDYLGRQQPRLLEVVKERLDRKKEAETRRRERQKTDPTQPPLAFYLGEGKKISAQYLSPSGKALWWCSSPRRPTRARPTRWPTSSATTATSRSSTCAPRSAPASRSPPPSPCSTSRTISATTSTRPSSRRSRTTPGRPAQGSRRPQGRREEEEGRAGRRRQKGRGQGQRTRRIAKTRRTTPRRHEPGRAHPRGLRRPLQPGRRTGGLQRRRAPTTRTAGWSPPRWPSRISARLHHLRRHGWINWDFNEFGFLAERRRPLFPVRGERLLAALPARLRQKREPAPHRAASSRSGDPTVSPDGKWIYVTANPDHPGIFGIYRAATLPVAAGGKVWEALTALGGTSEFRLSLDGGSLLLLHSKTTAPPELYVQEARPAPPPRQISHTTLPKFASIPGWRPEVVAIPSRHGGPPIYSRYYAPRAVGPRRGADGKIPAVMFIHGAGYLQNAHQGWSTYIREFFFHTWLAEHGYAVLDMDYRGSAGYGADFREAIYRQMGTPEVEDLEDGLAWLADNHGVDPQRVGLYGGSYGGFLTLMGLFTRPDVFACGAALRPVTDWAHYNHGYTSNILNTPTSTRSPTSAPRRSSSPPGSRSRSCSARACRTTTSSSRTPCGSPRS